MIGERSSRAPEAREGHEAPEDTEVRVDDVVEERCTRFSQTL